jgi:cell division septation protein DedD
MKKIVTILLFMSFSALFSQITITANLPSEISANSSIDAEIKINKGAVDNFAKYQIDVPLGYSVASVDVKGGNFTFENQRAKIVWVSIPSEPEFTVKFKIQANSDAASEGTFSQKFYYLENNEKKEIEATPIVITIGGSGSAVASTPAETTTPAETVVATPVEVVKPVETIKPPESNTTPVTSKVTTSSATAGLTFKVQIGAFSVAPSKSKFSNVGPVSIDLVNGLYKVTAGNFNTKEEAVKFLNDLQSKGYSGYVVFYKNGQRTN